MRKHIKIDGMGCQHCVDTVITVLKELGGTNIYVSLEGAYAQADIDADNDDITDEIEEEGFDAGEITEI